jgi:DNA-binding transcriptional MerR regulator
LAAILSDSPFTIRDVERLTGLKAAMIDYLCRTKIVVPSRMGSRGRGRGIRRVYSFGDVVLLRTYAKLLKAGVSVKRLKVAHGTWSRHFKTLDQQAPPGRFLVTDGERVYFRDQQQALVDLSGEGQLAFAFVIDLLQMREEVRLETVSLRTSG